MRRSSLPLVLLTALPLLAAFPSTAFAGPPWISIELPANPYDRLTKGAFLVVHAFHHGDPVGFPVSGKAEGIVNGQRKSVTLSFERTDRTGEYVLKNQWGSDGEWTLVISVSQGENDAATALVQVSAGSVIAVNVPTERRGDYTLPKKVTMADVEATLKNRPARIVAQQ